jgi:hypothetical protein
MAEDKLLTLRRQERLNRLLGDLLGHKAGQVVAPARKE